MIVYMLFKNENFFKISILMVVLTLDDVSYMLFQLLSRHSLSVRYFATPRGVLTMLWNVTWICWRYSNQEKSLNRYLLQIKVIKETCTRSSVCWHGLNKLELFVRSSINFYNKNLIKWYSTDIHLNQFYRIYRM